MFQNYFKIAIRNIFKNKLYSAINISGLTLGVAGSLLILIYVASQISYESFQVNRKNIYRVSIMFGNGRSSIKMAGAFEALAPAAAAEIPEVKSAVRFRVDRDAVIEAGNKKFTESNFFFADSNVFNVFTFPLIAGNKNTVLNNPSSIVISRQIARKYFGDSDPLGKRITYNGKYEFTVAGVMKDVPVNTMLRCELIAPYSKAIQINRPENSWTEWGKDYTYLYLRDNASIKKLNRDLTEIYGKNTNKVMASMLHFVIMPLKDIYFKSDMMGETGPTGNYTSVYLFASIAVLVLIIACLNFINLSTARSVRRSKEVGMRKVLGANRGRLVIQFLGESVFITAIAMIFGVVIFEIINPALYKYFDVPASVNVISDARFYLIAAAVFLSVSLFAGIYLLCFYRHLNLLIRLKIQNCRDYRVQVCGKLWLRFSLL